MDHFNPFPFGAMVDWGKVKKLNVESGEYCYRVLREVWRLQ